MSRAGSRPSVMKHQFSRAPQANINRSRFDRSHGYKTTFNAGNLIPFFVDEILPGDSMSLRVNALARLATPLHPYYDNLWLDTHFFFVPNRLLWDNWEKFMGSQDNPGDSTDFIYPRLSSVTPTELDLYDYFGIPTKVLSQQTRSLPFRAYNLIWNEWFRDQNLQDSIVIDTGDGPDDVTPYILRSRGKRHDYFTSCLPWPQKGPGVDLPLGTAAPVVTNNTPLTGPALALEVGSAASGTPSVAGRVLGIGTGGNVSTDTGSHGLGDPIYPLNLEADLTNATAATINELRQAFQIQKLYERDARGGTRYQELIWAHFQVQGNDARLQRPEYLGGGTTAVQVQTVPSTVPQDFPDNNTPQGGLAGYGTSVLSGHGFTKGFVEHGYVIGLISCRADLTYQQGLNRMWNRQTKHDFYWPALQAIGEQAVLNQEIYLQGVTPADTDVFGYQERFAEYRYKPSMVTGLFRSNATASLDPWHLSQDFATLPVLNDTFIVDKPPIERIIAVDTEPHFLLDAYFNYNCARPMPMYGVPGYIDHF